MPTGLDGNPNPIISATRNELIEELATALLRQRPDTGPMLVAIDGIDGSGKSTFGDELAASLVTRGETVVRSTIDSFHNRRDRRKRLGDRSAIGFYADSHDLDALRQRLLDPLRAGPGSSYRLAAFDEPSDQPLDPEPQDVEGSEIVVFDGIFLCRDELVDYWHTIIFLDGRQRVELERLGLVLEDAPEGGADLVGHVLEWVQRIDRYSSGMQIYLDLIDPRSRADYVIDNNDLARPRFVG